MGGYKGKKGDAELIGKIERKLGVPKFNTLHITPIKEGYIKYTDLISGGLTIFDLQVMNEAIVYYAMMQQIINEHSIENGGQTR